MIKINFNGCNSRMIIVVNLNSFRYIFQNNDEESQLLYMLKIKGNELNKIPKQ